MLQAQGSPGRGSLKTPSPQNFPPMVRDYTLQVVRIRFFFITPYVACVLHFSVNIFDDIERSFEHSNNS